ncbi:hypothetical protein KSS87_004956 [Heliosperma pusillum]|nr:hypothetical protein KSS87_004956 [Heliosperma pusillum]
MAIDITKMKEEEACFTRFYKIVLSWDYFNLSKSSKKSSKGVDKKEDELKKVKDTYTDVDDYFRTFEPLLFEEVKAQIVQTNDEEEETSMEQKLCLTKECSELDGFHFPVVMFLPEERESISQNDLLLLSNDKFRGQKLPSAYAFALVEHRQMDSLRLRVFLLGEVQGTNVQKIKPATRLSNMRSLLGERTPSLFISKVCSLSTIFREFVAIRSICSNPFKDVILRASDSNVNSSGPAWEIPSKLMESIESNHNESQLEAIRAGLSRKPFVLIQGPPGTGKTQTILGLLNAILHAVPARIHAKLQSHEMKRGSELPTKEKYHHWRLASPWLIGANPRDMIMPVDGDDGFFPTTGNELKPEVVSSNRKYRVRVLVCAPSNSALDEIVLRVLNTGVRDENDRAYHPKIVRIGLKAHHSVQSVSMDYLVEQKLSALGGHQATDRQKHGATGTDRDNIRASILDDAVIVFCTLSFSGSTIFSKMNRTFDIVIIDEAAQAVEPATLIPLAAGCKQVFLVGDPVQLPATVISPVAEKLGYGTSLFKRFQKAGYPVLMLKTQYRMHPEIRTFPSREFYEDALVDGEDVKDQTTRAWHDYHCFRPFCFFDITDGAETQPDGSGSWVNEDEVNFALLMYQELVTKYPDLKSSSKVAIISPYRRQDVAIFSCVRASKDKGIGFVSDYRRMNVGITRARSAVLVVGSASTLKKDKHWGNLIEAAVNNGTHFEVTKPYTSFFSEERMESMKKKVDEQPNDEESLWGDADDPEQENDHGEGDDDMGGDDD